MNTAKPRSLTTRIIALVGSHPYIPSCVATITNPLPEREDVVIRDAVKAKGVVRTMTYEEQQGLIAYELDGVVWYGYNRRDAKRRSVGKRR